MDKLNTLNYLMKSRLQITYFKDPLKIISTCLFGKID